jgi:hypothetical protein
MAVSSAGWCWRPLEPSTLAFPAVFAGGTVLVSLADTLMSEVFEPRLADPSVRNPGRLLVFVLAEV